MEIEMILLAVGGGLLAGHCVYMLARGNCRNVYVWGAYLGFVLAVIGQH